MEHVGNSALTKLQCDPNMLLLPFRTHRRLEHTGTLRCPLAVVTQSLKGQRILLAFLRRHCKLRNQSEKPQNRTHMYLISNSDFLLNNYHGG